MTVALGDRPAATTVPTVKVRIAAAAVGMLASMGACGSDDPGGGRSAPVGEGRPAGEGRAVGGGRPDCAKGERCPVTREQFSPQWPYTVDRGVLRCEIVEPSQDPTFDSRQGLLLEANGKTYALNLPAARVAAGKGWESSAEIEDDDPATSELSFLLWGLRICP